MGMSKPKIKNRDLPSRMVRRIRLNKGGKVEYFFYEHPRDGEGKRKLTSLGPDLFQAKTKWAELERKSDKEAGITSDDKSLSSIYSRYMTWAENREQSRLSLRTLKDRRQYWKTLCPVFGETPVDEIKPEHMMRYFDGRSAKVSAKKEIKFLSAMFNWARSRGFMSAGNPASGTTGQMKVKEGRDIYVTDEMLALVYECSAPVIQDAIDIAYLTGQRPADVLKMRWDQVKDGAVWVEQGKTSARLQISIVGELEAVLDRIKSRGVIGMTLLCDPKGQQLKQYGYFRSQFKLARDRAEIRAAELGVKFTRFQFMDLRAKSASDMESMAKARKLLGHSTETMTKKYIRKRVGEKVSPVLLSGYSKRENT